MARDEVVKDIGVSVEDACNGPVAFMQIGTLDDPERLVGLADVNMRVYGDYRVDRTYTATDWEEVMYLKIEPGNSSSGHGRIFFTIGRLGL